MAIECSSRAKALESSVARYLPWRQVVLRQPRPKARLQPDLRGRYGSYGALSRAPRRCKMPYTSAAAAVVTLSEPTRPRIGSATTSSQAARHAVAGRSPRSPAPAPRGPVVGRVVGHGASGIGPVDPGAGLLGLAEPVGEVAHAGDGRCSTAPAEALQTAGVTSAARRSGITTPEAPAASATRPRRRGCAGPAPGRGTTTSASSAASRASGVGVGIGLRPRHRRPGARASRTAARSPRRGHGHLDAPSQSSPAARSVAQTRSTGAGPRSASRTGLRP